jgi:hypothetical protein
MKTLSRMILLKTYLLTICWRWLSLALAGLPMKMQHIEDVESHEFPDMIFFDNMFALAFAGLS